MPPPIRPVTRTLWIMMAVACLVFGSVVGYVIGSMSGRPAPPGGPPAAAALPGRGDEPGTPLPAATPPSAFVDEEQIQSYRNVLARDPKNVRAAVQLANLYYDAGRFAEAIPLYRQAYALEPANVGVSTDLGTSLWYAGRPDEALAQFEKSLAVNPAHAQTLFNMGIVKLDGKQDPKGAIEAWERLLRTNPAYPDSAKVRELVAKARQRTGR
jgi:cytochrome c-type biogenesis protein CcmH/NrfG